VDGALTASASDMAIEDNLNMSCLSAASSASSLRWLRAPSSYAALPGWLAGERFESRKLQLQRFRSQHTAQADWICTRPAKKAARAAPNQSPAPTAVTNGHSHANRAE
jgi:hypothetical protein